MRCGIALGSNLGDRLVNLALARDAALEYDLAGGPLLQASVWKTAPVDCPPGSAAFYNSVIEIELGPDAAPGDFLARLQKIETGLGRPARAARAPNAPRVIDLDLLYIDDLTRDTRVLTLPHPRLHLRRFVLAPLAEIRPSLILPGLEGTVADLLENLESDETPPIVMAREW